MGAKAPNPCPEHLKGSAKPSPSPPPPPRIVVPLDAALSPNRLLDNLNELLALQNERIGELGDLTADLLERVKWLEDHSALIAPATIRKER